ncbi:hypothetical protein ASG43_03155 [Aureimonas sp. Leaf454]|uniref:hypothetical protein n=1 Tax=Aureimonas sp. Leaf454 TaxID=1736381 RepID=UPI0006F959D1|nr:hypothetical protein [Aureimonas sp. Leaf454]KQT54597.1 hypothetical protein ASG43_03155 [Aureimonas sp. Leaf454]
MSLRDKLPADEIMREMAKLALEQATASLATKAREFAKTLPPQVTGAEALLAFAAAIDGTNHRQFGSGEKPS